MFYIVEKIVIAIACYVDICAIWARVVALGADNITAIATVFIAVCALGVTLWQGMETRKHNRLSVRPSLVLRITEGKIDAKKPNAEIKFIIANNGSGSAFIKKTIREIDDKKFAEGDSQKYMEALAKIIEDVSTATCHDISSASIMKPGEEIVLISFEYTSHEKKIEALKKIKLFLEYQSAYEEKFKPLSYKYDSKIHYQESRLVPDTIAQKMADIHATCFTIPRPWTLQEFTNVQEKSNELCLLQHVTQSTDSPLCGFVVGQKLDEEQFELLTLAVTPHEQGKGHGFDLLKSFIARVKEKGGKSIFLEVAKNNTSALHLYKKAGFKRVGLRPAYYEVPNTPNIDAITMRLDIKTP